MSKEFSCTRFTLKKLCVGILTRLTTRRLRDRLLNCQNKDCLYEYLFVQVASFGADLNP